jgi:hypothetical protein
MKPQFYSIHLAFNRGYFEAIFIKIQSTLGINVFVMQIEDVYNCCTNFAKKMEWNLHESIIQWKIYGKLLFSKDLEVQDDHQEMFPK